MAQVGKARPLQVARATPGPWFSKMEIDQDIQYMALSTFHCISLYFIASHEARFRFPFSTDGTLTTQEWRKFCASFSQRGSLEFLSYHTRCKQEAESPDVSFILSYFIFLLCI